MSAGLGDYHMVGDSWVSPGLVWSSEPGVRMIVDQPCRIDISGYVSISGCRFDMNIEPPGRYGFLTIHIWGYKAENQLANIDMSPACVEVITEGY